MPQFSFFRLLQHRVDFYSLLGFYKLLSHLVNYQLVLALTEPSSPLLLPPTETKAKSGEKICSDNNNAKNTERAQKLHEKGCE